MSDRHVYVYLDFRGEPTLVGELWSRAPKGRETSSFRYDAGWLTHPERFALEPALRLDPGASHTAVGKAIFGALGDSAPDRWGRTLMRRAARRAAAAEHRTAQTLLEIDFLLGVSDEARQGALRFAQTPGGPFLSDAANGHVPPLVELPQLLAAATHVVDEAESADDMRLLLAPGSSLGGARPKASVRSAHGQLAIAKFPVRQDDYDVVRWEAVALTLAKHAGIRVPEWSLERVSDRAVLLVARFDRQQTTRIPYLSAMSMLAASDNDPDPHSYLEIADAVRMHGATPQADLRELWRRLVFTVLISNVDDHLRNHGFLHVGPGWQLSPVFDINPVPVDVRPRVLTTAIDLDDATASLDLALSVASYFDLTELEAKRIAAEVGSAVAAWRTHAKVLGVQESELTRMASAFQHRDLELALAY